MLNSMNTVLSIDLGAPFGTSGMLTYTIEGTNTQVAAMWDVPSFADIASNWFNIKVNFEMNLATTIQMPLLTH